MSGPRYVVRLAGDAAALSGYFDSPELAMAFRDGMRAARNLVLTDEDAAGLEVHEVHAIAGVEIERLEYELLRELCKVAIPRVALEYLASIAPKHFVSAHDAAEALRAEFFRTEPAA